MTRKTMWTLRALYGVPEDQLLIAGSHREQHGPLLYAGEVVVGFVDGCLTYEFAESFWSRYARGSLAEKQAHEMLREGIGGLEFDNGKVVRWKVSP